jgi:hypothetical protein
VISLSDRLDQLQQSNGVLLYAVNLAKVSGTGGKDFFQASESGQECVGKRLHVPTWKGVN